ncbi:MAG: epoxide hydrolase [Deltaproteobacteria bacterium]|nr:epoxide hydrolase [Deltaproteobacteria bacterium]MBI3389391.1 epoxide hydrolase [Deltaproteobacteria bacterium]
MAIEPFRINVPDHVLDDLKQRLARTRFPDEVNDADWSYGTDLAYLKELVEYWRTRYDWRAAERALNQLHHFRSDIEGLGVHFIHERGVGPKPLPLLISHGWPGSVVEFLKIIGPLTDPARHGGDAADAFDVVAPSLPGYGFSDHPRSPGMHPGKMADVFAALMAQLGYTRYGAQGGDWGAIITTCLGSQHAKQLAGIHLNMVVAFPPDEANPGDGLNEAEIVRLMEMQRFMREETGYQQIQGTKPQTLGYALNDSPAGLAAWIVEKFRTWTDCNGNVESRLSKDEMLTNITIYWVTETAPSSIRLYCEAMRSGLFPPRGIRIDVPTGCAIFPKELFKPPRAWAEKVYDVQRWTEFESGGHFAAMEEPQALVDDIRAFFRPLRG